MLHAYVDESYSSDFYYIAAAVGTPQAWATVSVEFEQIRQRTAAIHGTPLDAEFQGHEIMGGKGEWSVLLGKHREAAGVFQAALRACRTSGIEFILRGVDVERLNDHALARKDRPVVVVADEIATQEQHVAQFQAYQVSGTPGYRTSRLGATHHHVCKFASPRWPPGRRPRRLPSPSM